MKDNRVIFKGIKNGLLIKLDDKSDFETIKKSFQLKVTDAKNFLKNAKATITFKGRELTVDQELELIDIINKSCELNISYVKNNDPTNDPILPKFTEKATEAEENNDIDNEENNNKETNETNLDKLLNKALYTAKKNLTTFHKGAVRSGQAIKFPGSVVVIGDVNPGGEIIAEGNIIVLGILKGLVHAGCNGSEECFVAALNMMPTQLRISGLIACFPSDLNRNLVPEYAYIKDNQIYVEPLL